MELDKTKLSGQTICRRFKDENIRKKIEEELREKSRLSIIECNYNPSYFNNMLDENGGVRTAKILIEKAIRTGKVSDGYTNLLLKNRLDLTMENSVVKPEYKVLFSKEEIDYCNELLG